jgi:hypothetical protein
MKVLNSLRTLALTASCAALVWTGAIAADCGKGEYGNPGIAAPHSQPYGLTYGEWSAVWWQWEYALPVPKNPLFMDGNVDLSLNQPEGPVWFLGGTFSPTVMTTEILGKADRTGTVPQGKALFFPILNSELDNPTDPAPDETYPGNYTIAELRAQCKAGIDSVVGMECEIDGVSVKNLSDPLTTPYRAVAPTFRYWLPPKNNVQQSFGLDVSGWIYPAEADGVFLMLEPLAVGKHTIHFAGEFPGTLPFILDITYHITVVPCRGDRDGDRH